MFSFEFLSYSNYDYDDGYDVEYADGSVAPKALLLLCLLLTATTTS